MRKIAALKTSLDPPAGGKKAESTKMLEDLLRQCIGDLDESRVLSRVQTFDRVRKKTEMAGRRVHTEMRAPLAIDTTTDK